MFLTGCNWIENRLFPDRISIVTGDMDAVESGFLLRGRRCCADNIEVPFILISLFSTQENFILPRQENSDSARAITSFSR